MLVDEYGRSIGISQPKPHASSFDTMGKLIYKDEKSGIQIMAGNVFEARTVKGGWNLLIAFRRIGDHLVYMHGDKAKKIPLHEFVRAVEAGDVIPRSIHEIDPGRLELCSIALDAIANRRTAEETIAYIGEHAEERYHRGE